jgi:hypothetical protein
MLKPKSIKSSGCTHSPNNPQHFKQMLPACKKADGNRFLGQERSAGNGNHATRDHNNISRVLQNTEKTT